MLIPTSFSTTLVVGQVLVIVLIIVVIRGVLIVERVKVKHIIDDAVTSGTVGS